MINVEIPGSGNDSLTIDPFADGKSLHFASLNYDRQNIALNLKQPADLEIFKGLVQISDVLVENYRPGTMEKLVTAATYATPSIGDETCSFANTPANLGLAYNRAGLLHFMQRLPLHEVKEMFFTVAAIKAEDAALRGKVPAGAANVSTPSAQ